MTPSPDWDEKAAKEGGSDEEDAEGAPAEEASLTGRFQEEQELLRRHIRILKFVKENEPVGIIKLSELTDYPQHKVRYSLRVLEDEGLIEPTSMGARTTDLIEEFIPKVEEILTSMQQTVEDLRQVAG